MLYACVNVVHSCMFTVDCVQVGYTEQNTDYTLYLVAGEHTERLHWIHTIRSGKYRVSCASILLC